MGPRVKTCEYPEDKGVCGKPATASVELFNRKKWKPVCDLHLEIFRSERNWKLLENIVAKK